MKTIHPNEGLRLARNTALAAALASALSCQPASAGPMFSPSPVSVDVGDTFTLSLNDTLPPLDPIFGGVEAVDLEVSFDSALLDFENAGLGSLTGDWPAPDFNAVGGGVEDVSLSVCSFTPPFSCGTDAAGSGSVVKLTFMALSGGATSIKVVNRSPGAPSTYQFSDAAADVSDDINITAAALQVPEPGVSYFLLPAFFVLWHLRRRA